MYLVHDRRVDVTCTGTTSAGGDSAPLVLGRVLKKMNYGSLIANIRSKCTALCLCCKQFTCMYTSAMTWPHCHEPYGTREHGMSSISCQRCGFCIVV